MRAIEVTTVVRGYLSPPGPPESGFLHERWDRGEFVHQIPSPTG